MSSPELVAADLRRVILGRSLLFGHLGNAELDDLLARASLRRAGRGEPIIHRGDAAGPLFIIAAGRVRVSLTSEEGREVTIGLLGAGEVLGEMSLLDSEPCSADVAAHEDCTLLAIDRAHVLRLLRADNDLCLRLLAAMAIRLRRANSALEDIALLDLPARLGRLLTRLAREFGRPTPAGQRIEVAFSQRELATLIGSSREKVNRLLREWQADGTLAREGARQGGRLVILRPERIRFDW